MTTTGSGEGAPPDQPIVEVRDVTKRYGRTLALDAISLSINPGEVFALLGPNGAGKTTLIHILCTILRPDTGTATICGFDIARQPLRARRNLGVVFQEPSLDGRLTVEENLNFHGLVYEVPGRLRRQRITEMLALVELSDVRQRLVRTLSSGMRRRVEIARALIHDAKVVILDEPTVGLDAQSRGRIWEYLETLRKQRDLTIIVTTHYIDEVDGCDRVCIIERGNVLALDTPDALRERFGREVIRVRATDADTTAAIVKRFPEATIETNGEIAIPGQHEGVMETLLREYGTSIRNVSFERPSLESVFLGLTGRELRDEPREKRAAG